MVIQDEALQYHLSDPKGKIEVIPTKPCKTDKDLSLAYTPGVAIPCLEIEQDPAKSYQYTARGNLVAVISNGTAVLGLGNIGPEASKPVMEGKGVLFKRFANIDVFDLEIAETDIDRFCTVVKALEPTFGGINLEDIKSPECFEIEERLKKEMDIPVFHDDQHGTAIITAGALQNALELAHKKIEEIKIVVSGAGAAAIACTNLQIALGAKRENIIMTDINGVLYKGRSIGMNQYKEPFTANTDARTLAEAMVGADLFMGLSAAGIVNQEMIQSMAPNPIVFALANPNPEITYPVAMAARDDLIMATGRSDYPNQVNNVLGFPFIFRGALDCHASAITENMKIAAAKELAKLAKEPVSQEVIDAYGIEFKFGSDYIIPKPFDPRILLYVAPAVAKAAMEDGVARKELDLTQYQTELLAHLETLKRYQ